MIKLFVYHLNRPITDIRKKNTISLAHPVKIELNEKLDPKQKTIQAFNIDA